VTPAVATTPEIRHKIRFRFRKDGDLRFVSHHDLMRCLERTLRRAEIPFRTTSGFHPHPRMVFALSLSLGIIGAEEVVEIELSEVIPADEALARVSFQAPPGMTFLSAREIPFNRTAIVRRMVFAIEIPPERRADVEIKLDALLKSEDCWVIRVKPSPRKVNIRPYIRDLRWDDSTLVFDLWVTTTGTARADELLGVLGCRDWLNAGGVLTRTQLEVIDELDADALAQSPNPERFIGLSMPIDRVPEDMIEPEDETPSAQWGLSPNGPVSE